MLAVWQWCAYVWLSCLLGVHWYYWISLSLLIFFCNILTVFFFQLPLHVRSFGIAHISQMLSGFFFSLCFSLVKFLLIFYKFTNLLLYSALFVLLLSLLNEISIPMLYFKFSLILCSLHLSNSTFLQTCRSPFLLHSFAYLSVI